MDSKLVYVSYVDTNGGFYVQTVDRLADLCDLGVRLDTMLSDNDHLNDVAVGDVVRAHFSDDDLSWHRALIESCISHGQFVIRFIDFGHSEVVRVNQLKALPQELDISTVPPFAVKCRFFGFSNNLTAEQADKFRETVAEQTVNVVYRSQEDDVQEVEMYLNVAKSLGLESGTFQPVHWRPWLKASSISGVELPVIRETLPVSGAAHAGDIALISVSTGKRMAVTVSHVVSPDKLYIQLNENKPGLEDMMNAMFNHFSAISSVSQSLEAACVGDVCAAQFEDESWCRVKIESLANDGSCEIFYTDFGSSATVDVTSLQILPECFKSLPPWALKAKLGGVEPREGCWTPECLLEIKMVEGRHLLADVLQVNSDGDELTVHLLDRDIPVHEMLIKKGHAVAVDGGPLSQTLDQFYSDGDSYGASALTDETSGCLESMHMEEESSVAEDNLISDRMKIWIPLDKM